MCWQQRSVASTKGKCEQVVTGIFITCWTFSTFACLLYRYNCQLVSNSPFDRPVNLSICQTVVQVSSHNLLFYPPDLGREVSIMKKDSKGPVTACSTGVRSLPYNCAHSGVLYRKQPITQNTIILFFLTKTSYPAPFVNGSPHANHHGVFWIKRKLNTSAFVVSWTT